MKSDGVAATAIDPIDVFRREHGNIGQLVLVLESQLARIHVGEDCDDGLLLDVLRYLAEYVDPFHHAHEDRMIEAIVAREPALRTVTHELTVRRAGIHESGAALRERLERALLDELVPRRELVETGFAYSAALKQSIALEEADLFPLAAERLTCSDWIAIEAERGLRPDAPRFDDVVNERFRRAYEALTCQVGCECRYL